MIVHLAKSSVQKVINLGEWEFVNFVNHTQMAERRIYKENYEAYCNIMFMVRRKDKLRLMCYRTNPWVLDDNAEFIEEKDKDSIILFSGVIAEDEEFSRKRYDSDKIQACELLTRKIGKQERFMLIV